MRGKSLGLFFNECGVVEIVDLHCAAHVVERGCCYGAGIGAALLQHVVDGGNVLRKFLAALADRFEEFLHDIGVALGVSLGFFLDGGSEFVGFLLSFLRRAGSRREGGGGQKQGAGQQDPKFFYTYLEALDSGAVG